MALIRVHASAVVLREWGVVIRGESGAGKTSLALALIEKTLLKQQFAAIIGDDRVNLTALGGRLVAQRRAKTAGLAERRGLGLVRAPHLAAAVVALVVDLRATKEPPQRMPEAGALRTRVGGVEVARLALTHALSVESCAALVLDALVSLATIGSSHVDFP
jgi:HPr kinase/phosphorylase